MHARYRDTQVGIRSWNMEEQNQSRCILNMKTIKTCIFIRKYYSLRLTICKWHIKVIMKVVAEVKGTQSIFGHSVKTCILAGMVTNNLGIWP